MKISNKAIVAIIGFIMIGISTCVLHSSDCLVGLLFVALIVFAVRDYDVKECVEDEMKG